MQPDIPLPALPVRLTHGEAQAWVDQWLAGFERAPGSAVQVDASALETFDSSALAVLLEARRRALAAGRPFGVQGMPARLHQLAVLYGVDTLLAPVH